MTTRDPPGTGDTADEFAQVGPVLEGREDLAQLVALREFRSFHHVEQAVREDLLDRRRVVVEQDPDDPLADATSDALDPIVLVEATQCRLGRRRGLVEQALVEEAGDLVEGRLVDRLGLVEGDRRLLDGPFAEHEDEARHPLVDGDEVDPPDVGRARLGRRRDARRAGETGKGRGRETEPVLAGELDLTELVPDHQLLDGRQRHGIDDRFDIEAIARVGRHATGTRVGVRQEASRLEVGEDVPDSRTRHAKAIALDERQAADRLCRRDVFLDDGPKDRLGAEVQRAEWAANASRQTRSPVVLALDG